MSASSFLTAAMSAAVAADTSASPLPPRSLCEQFGNPTGWLGSLVGRLMSATGAERSLWVLSLLKLEPHHRLLEIGYGPGNDVERASWVLTQGRVTGIDHSEAMLRMATRRNAEAIARGRVELHLGTAARLPYEDSTFDRLISINCVQFWPDLVGGLKEARRVLRPEGLMAVAVQPRHKGATSADTDVWREKLSVAAKEAGLVLGPTGLQVSATRPTPTVCLIAGP